MLLREIAWREAHLKRKLLCNDATSEAMISTLHWSKFLRRWLSQLFQGLYITLNKVLEGNPTRTAEGHELRDVNTIVPLFRLGHEALRALHALCHVSLR